MEKESCYLKDFGYEKFEKVVDMIGGKWKLRIIYMLAMYEVLRYSELKQLLTPITHKMLTAQLKELEKDGLINRTDYKMAIYTKNTPQELPLLLLEFLAGCHLKF